MPERITNEDLWRLSDQEPVELELECRAWRKVGLGGSKEDCPEQDSRWKQIVSDL